MEKKCLFIIFVQQNPCFWFLFLFYWWNNNKSWSLREEQQPNKKVFSYFLSYSFLQRVMLWRKILKTQSWKYLKTWGSLRDVLSFLDSCSFESNLHIFSLALSVALWFFFFQDFRFQTTLKWIFISIIKVAWLCVDMFQVFPFLQS